MFIRWLKESGINYKSPAVPRNLPDDPEQAKAILVAYAKVEMLDSLNPFEEITNPTIPHGWFYHSSLYRRLYDTYDVFTGNHYDLFNQRGQGRKGILDLLIFPVIARRLSAYAYIKDHKPTALRVLAGIIGYPLEVARHVTAIALTLVLSPIIMLFHGIVSIWGKSARKKIAAIKTLPVDNEGAPLNLTNPTLPSLYSVRLIEKKADIQLNQDLKNDSLEKSIDSPQMDPKLFSSSPLPAHDDCDSLVFSTVAPTPCHEGPSDFLKIKLDSKDPANIDGVNSLIETNWQGIATMLSKNKRNTPDQKSDLTLLREKLAIKKVTGAVVEKTLKKVYPAISEIKALPAIICTYVGNPTDEQEKLISRHKFS